MHNRIGDRRFLGAGTAIQHRKRSEPDTGAAGELLRQQVEHFVSTAGQFVATHPGVCLGAALAAGMILGWLVKRK